MINPLAFKEIKQHKKIMAAMLGTSVLNALAVVGQAWYFANLVTDLFIHDRPITDLGDTLIPLGIAVLVRLITSYGQEAAAIRLAHAG